ncbi:glycosyltransferase family 2 protein [Pseudoalteromonas sp. SS15]|uniref:glycosyltransferase family 2 protein n=1 Tax=Pseudoalteromonas sp. SS15 TaxID=3139393 RepID=UPI003BA9D324
MSRKKISVIIPCFNLEEHIGTTLECVLKQSIGLENFEVIIVDDFSTDNSCEIVREFVKQNSNLYLIELDSNQGPGNARNKALEIASGEYYFFLDGDDYISDDALELVYNEASTKEVDLLFYNYGLIENVGDPAYAFRKDLHIIELYKSNKEELIKEFLAAELDGSVIFSLVKSDLVKRGKITFPDGLHEDIPFIFECYLHAEKIDTLSKVIYFKKFRKESIINNLTFRQIDGLIEAWLSCFDKVQGSQLVPHVEIYTKFMRGLVGCIASLLQKNLVFHADSFADRVVNYNYIFKKSKSIGLFDEKALPFETIKDKHFSNFFRVYSEFGVSGDSAEFFESQAIKLGIIEKGSFVRA